MRNTHAGLTGIGTGMRQAAMALGLAPRERLRLIEVPLALPSILAGIKTSAVINVGTATIAAFIGAGGYGERIASGLALNDNITLLAGAIPAARSVAPAWRLRSRRRVGGGRGGGPLSADKRARGCCIIRARFWPGFAGRNVKQRRSSMPIGVPAEPSRADARSATPETVKKLALAAINGSGDVARGSRQHPRSAYEAPGEYRPSRRSVRR